jgi:hypothetical protein
LQKDVTVAPVSFKKDLTFSLNSNLNTPFLIYLFVCVVINKKNIILASSNRLWIPVTGRPAYVVYTGFYVVIVCLVEARRADIAMTPYQPYPQRAIIFERIYANCIMQL